MANAKAREITKVVDRVIDLTLTEAEAKALQAIQSRVGGSSFDGGPRGLIDEISKTLDPLVGSTTQCAGELKEAGFELTGHLRFEG